jgi:hypothetical protein
MNDKKYNLVNTNTDTILKENIELSHGEMHTLNYAYALNGVSKRYISTDPSELNMFEYIQPI